MRITVFNGSSRGEKGNTHIMVEEFLKGAREAGAETENIILVEKSIKHCLACFTCWMKTPGKCVTRDDMEGLLQKFMDSDIVVYATPVYVDNVSGLMKNFTDRHLPIIDPYFEKDEAGEYRHRRRYDKYPKIAVISNCAYPEQSHFQVIRLLFKRIARNIYSEVVGEIYRGGGQILRSRIPTLQPLIEAYKESLRMAGKELAENLKLSKETIEKLESPMMPHDLYIKLLNDSWDRYFSKQKSSSVR
ncbi:MAG: flavodoxin family protein [Candidatus Hodarchaeota archaeon]